MAMLFRSKPREVKEVQLHPEYPQHHGDTLLVCRDELVGFKINGQMLQLLCPAFSKAAPKDGCDIADWTRPSFWVNDKPDDVFPFLRFLNACNHDAATNVFSGTEYRAIWRLLTEYKALPFLESIFRASVTKKARQLADQRESLPDRAEVLALLYLGHTLRNAEIWSSLCLRGRMSRTWWRVMLNPFQLEEAEVKDLGSTVVRALAFLATQNALCGDVDEFVAEYSAKGLCFYRTADKEDTTKHIFI
ncbi:uncharacterized protein LOC62_07G009268 [Vanrija pseudolonga]|uniref:Uncharacterized protein n=1 Tax=Vanrija pseudolonga TaxID=143232 RepID=A0AAF1BM21_9TREE|nr:hypothetical protein LOC62_07G009268 [Vanrija pseudolonga]